MSSVQKFSRCSRQASWGHLLPFDARLDGHFDAAQIDPTGLPARLLARLLIWLQSGDDRSHLAPGAIDQGFAILRHGEIRHFCDQRLMLELLEVVHLEGAAGSGLADDVTD